LFHTLVELRASWFISCNTCDDFLKLVFYYFHYIGSFLGSDQAAISKVNHDSDAFELESFHRHSFLGESEKNTYDKTSTSKLEENKEGRSIMFKKDIQECQFSEGFGITIHRIASCSFC